jgi:hypothetical protein
MKESLTLKWGAGICHKQRHYQKHHINPCMLKFLTPQVPVYRAGHYIVAACIAFTPRKTEHIRCSLSLGKLSVHQPGSIFQATVLLPGNG